MSDTPAPTRAREQNPWLRLLLLAAVLLLLVMFFWGPQLWLKLTGSAEASLSSFSTPAELALPHSPQVPADENGFAALMEACKLMPPKPTEFEFDAAWATAVDGSWVPNKGVEGVLDRSRPAWEKLDKALGSPQWLCPQVKWGEPSPLPMAELRFLAQSKVADAKRLLAAGKADEAAQVALKLVQFGQQLQNCQGALVEFTSGVVIEGMGESILLKALDSPRISDAQLKAIALRPLDMAPANARWETTLKIMFSTLLRDEFVSASPNQRPLPARFFDKDATAQMIARDFLVELKNTAAPFAMRDLTLQRRIETTRTQAESLKDEVDYFRKSGRVSWRLALAPNAYGRWLQFAAVPASEKVEVFRCHDIFARHCNSTLAALLLYRRQHAALPDSLTSLVADGLLERAPQDPFDLAPLRYSKDKQRVWCVGLDGADQGGERPMSLEVALDSTGDWVVLIPTHESPEASSAKK